MPKKITKESIKKTIKKVRSRRNSLLKELRRSDFRVTIFGSARTKPDDKIYIQVFNLAKEIGEQGFDVVTGGGPGLMDAGNAGHEAGDPKNHSDSIGLAIKLPHEQGDNKHLDLRKHFAKFSDRLDNFMALSSVVVVMPGGVGSCLEFFYTWQLIQVGHIHPIPIILVGKMWKKLMKWVKKYPLKDGLISPHEMTCVHIAKNNKEAMKIILKAHEKFANGTELSNKHYLER